MREEELYGILYTINRSKKLCDQKIGVPFHDIYINETDFAGKVMPIQTQDGTVYGLTIGNLDTLFEKVCDLKIKHKRTAMINEILSRELKKILNQCMCTTEGNLPVISPDIIHGLVRKTMHFIEVRENNEKQYQNAATVAYHRTEERTVRSDDGFEVKYKVFGQDKIQTMVLINAYGIQSEIWKNMIYYYSGKYRVVVWETRGTMPEHTNVNMQPIMFSLDLESILRKEQIKKAILVCWCSGLKILAEFYKRNPCVASSIVIIAGYFNPFPETGSYWSDFDNTIGKLSQMIVKDRSLSKNPLILGLIQKLFRLDIGEKRLESLLSAEASEYERYDIQNTLVRNAALDVKQFITLPFNHSQTLQNYAEITIELQKHEILSMLSEIAVPTLIINAGKDMVTDIHCARMGRAYIHNSQMVELPNATHWCIWENYEEIISEIERFMAEAAKKNSISGKAENNEG